MTDPREAWIPFAARHPARKDCDARGDVLVLRSGRAMLWRVKPEPPVDATHWQPVAVSLPKLPKPDESSAPNYGICFDQFSWDLVEQIQLDAYAAGLARSVQDGFVAVPLDALREVLRISDREHPAWNRLKAVLAKKDAG